MSVKTTRSMTTALCVSLASLVITLLFGTALVSLWLRYEATVAQLESRLKKCEQPFDIMTKVSRAGNKNIYALCCLVGKPVQPSNYCRDSNPY